MPSAVACLALATLLTVPAFSQTTPPPLRIMPLGDSITYGSGAAGGYRLPLYTALTNLGYNVDFVGSATDNAAPGLGAEINHEGHSGWRISNPGNSNGLYEYLPTWLPSYADPDVILVHIGTNDTNDPNFENAINELDALITYLATQRPFAHIIVTTLMKRGANDQDSLCVKITTQFNPYVAGIVSAQQALGRRVHLLDLYPLMERTDMSDNLHPHAAGYAKMAAAWLPAITAIVTPYGDSLPPAVASVKASPANSTLAVTFSKPIDFAASPAIANPAAWTLSPAGIVTAVSAPSADGRTVTLSLAGTSTAPTTLSFAGTVADLVPTTPDTVFSGAVGVFAPPIIGRTWTGLGPDALWTTPANWAGGLVPSGTTATFSGNGNGRTAVSLGAANATVSNVGDVTFAADAAAYTLGLPGQTLTLLNEANITLAAGSANDQTIAASVLASGNLNIYNNEPSKTLTLSYTNTAARSLFVYGNGPVTFNALRRPAGTETVDDNNICLHLRSPAPVTCTTPLVIGQLWKDNAYPPSELILAPHTTNIFCRNQWAFALSGATISGGEGTVLRLLHATAGVPAAIAVQTANPVTISVRLECPTGLATLNNGGSGWANGTLVLDYPDNLIDGPVIISNGNCFQ
ncbi:MAG: GDSL-type esterase/lipase family protein, partial [Verrucomicrobiota bacterium]|nr:GDSL-type esterase/lipase family protein [Verrucomicrobiota bacterium]